MVQRQNAVRSRLRKRFCAQNRKLKTVEQIFDFGMFEKQMNQADTENEARQNRNQFKEQKVVGLTLFLQRFLDLQKIDFILALAPVLQPFKFTACGSSYS
ncbi:hypothetical protein L596_011573 [Steinernema carpocapsae]|uniref:Uncharacterized protein n=1 Tax=Steinernema carpocapsae TaxID=34508 RepID=A0A4U5NUR2_STECR|nr:hypothetical protein L596_011573 [Steinernema carpocapsae]